MSNEHMYWKNELHSNLDYSFDCRMSISKSKYWYSNNCLYFLKRAVPLSNLMNQKYVLGMTEVIWIIAFENWNILVWLIIIIDCMQIFLVEVHFQFGKFALNELFNYQYGMEWHTLKMSTIVWIPNYLETSGGQSSNMYKCCWFFQHQC